jgi:hypothetical protein
MSTELLGFSGYFRTRDFSGIITLPKHPQSVENGGAGAMAPAGAPNGDIEVTAEMIRARIAELYRTIPMDIAKPLLCDEDIVERIFTAMSRQMCLRADRAPSKAQGAS